MGSLDNMLENQQVIQKESNKQNNGSTLLCKVSTVYKWLGGLLLVIGIIVILFAISKEKEDAVTFGLCVLSGGLFTLFGGCIGEAIDDIRNSIKK